MEADSQGLDLIEIGARICALRKDRSLKQEDFAGIIGVDQSALSRVEQGKRPPSAKLIFGIAQHLPKEDVLFLLTGKKIGHLQLAENNQRNPEEPINTEILTQIIAGVEDGLDREGLRLSPNKKAHLISILYDHFKTKGQLDTRTFGSYLALVK